MRKEFAEIVVQIGIKDDKIVLLSGDLGYSAFENMQNSFKERFINTGVAEQNMIGVAAGLAYKGFKVFCYSIAPFVVYRCLEQVRNDVCFHNLPVFIVGNGGGYGYGVMGSTHHAIEDLACLSSLPNIDCWIPAFTDDVDFTVNRIIENNKPAYLRLGNSIKRPYFLEKYSAINSEIVSENPVITVVALGPVVQNVLKAAGQSGNIDLFTVLKMPVYSLNDAFISSINKTGKLLVIEEHVSRGGLAENISLKLLEMNIKPDKFKSIFAQGYPDGLYGSQAFHQKQSGLDSDSISDCIKELVAE